MSGCAGWDDRGGRPPGVSAISCWEAAMLHKRNRIALRALFQEWLPAALEGSDKAFSNYQDLRLISG
jgi:PIN domain nuclease of toxin-antitoxin system